MKNISIISEENIEEMLDSRVLIMGSFGRDRDRDRDSDRNRDRDSDRSKCNTEIIGSVDDLYSENVIIE